MNTHYKNVNCNIKNFKFGGGSKRVDLYVIEVKLYMLLLYIDML